MPVPEGASRDAGSRARGPDHRGRRRPFDALLSDRSYRRALPLEDALEVMRQGSGGQFDPLIVDVLLGHLDEALEIRS